jgi:protein TonB
MLDRLVASAPLKSWSLSGTMMSIVFHAGVLYAAVHLTMSAGKSGSAAPADTTLVFIQPEEQQEKPAPPPEVQLAEMPEGFRTLVAPIGIPTDIPPVNTREVFDPRDYTGVGRELPSQVLRGNADVTPGAAYAEASVDEKPEIISSPPLKYPDILRQAGIQGDVLVETIIDTSGRAEPNSVRVVRSSHPAFEKEAVDVVAKSLYRPGRMNGWPVRVLVNVPVSFSIRKPVA